MEILTRDLFEFLVGHPSVGVGELVGRKITSVQESEDYLPRYSYRG
jgi:hypothetical protein